MWHPGGLRAPPPHEGQQGLRCCGSRPAPSRRLPSPPRSEPGGRVPLTSVPCTTLEAPGLWGAGSICYRAWRVATAVRRAPVEATCPACRPRPRPVCRSPHCPSRRRRSRRRPLGPYRASADMSAKDRKEHAPRVSPHCSLVPNGGGSGRGPKGPQSCGGGPYRMGGSRGPPTGELRRGAPGKGGGPFAAAFTCRAETGTF